MAQHYSEFHRNIVAQLQLEIIDYAAKTVRRKITEALYIHREKPEINNKPECVNISKYLVLWCHYIPYFVVIVYTVHYT